MSFWLCCNTILVYTARNEKIQVMSYDHNPQLQTTAKQKLCSKFQQLVLFHMFLKDKEVGIVLGVTIEVKWILKL